MAYKTISSLLPHIFILSILLTLAGQALAARGNPNTAQEKGEMKQPEWLFKSHDHSVLIPGIGRVMVPPAFTVPSSDPYNGHSGGTGTGTGTSGSHIPGGDDTFVPNPGHVPTSGSGSGAPPALEARP